MQFFADNEDYRKHMREHPEDLNVRFIPNSPAEEANVISEIPKLDWPDPTDEMLKTREFEAVWQCIKSWDINVPRAYVGYCGATGNHVRAILDALTKRSL